MTKTTPEYVNKKIILLCLALMVSLLLSGISPAMAQSTIAQTETDRNTNFVSPAMDQADPNESSSAEEEYIIKYK